MIKPMDAALDKLSQQAEWETITDEQKGAPLHTYALGWIDGRLSALTEWREWLERRLSP